jgi:hypothetical protein
VNRPVACAALILLAACSSHRFRLPKDKEDRILELQKAFDALGPFVAEFEAEGEPPADIEGKSYKTLVVAADVGSSRLHFGLRGDSPGILWLLHFDGHRAYGVDPKDGKATRMEFGLVIQQGRRMSYEVQRALSRILNEPPEFKTYLDYERSHRPILDIRFAPGAGEDDRSTLSVNLGSSQSGRCGWLGRILNDPDSEGEDLGDAIRWTTSGGGSVTTEKATGLPRAVEIKRPNGTMSRLILRALQRGPLPADATFPKEYILRHISQEESASIYWGMLGYFAKSLTIAAAPGEKFNSDEIAGLIRIVASSEFQLLRGQTHREWMRQFVEHSVRQGVTPAQLKSDPQVGVRRFAEMTHDHEPKLREAIHARLAGRKEEFRKTFRAESWSDGHKAILDVLLDDAFRADKIESAPPVVPAPTADELLDEALRLASTL